jgi:NADPH:quinone reductase-like Zn-dependent oxidoreductase
MIAPDRGDAGFKKNTPPRPRLSKTSQCGEGQALHVCWFQGLFPVMRAIVFEEHGDLDRLVSRELPDPISGPDEVRVQIRAVALNRLDIFVRQGWPGLKLKMPHILGSDIAGVVDQVGENVDHIAVGDEVVLGPGTSCGTCQTCLAGCDNRCPSYAILGEHIRGGYAELITVSKKNVFAKPPNLSFEEAACLPLVFTTAWGMLVEQAQLASHETVLIHAGGSGVGSAAIQVAKMIGARVITTASTSNKLEKARSLGADDTINYVEEDFAKKTWQLTGKEGVDVVFEHTGGVTFPGSLRSLKIGGRLVTCGATTKPKVEIDIRLLFAKHLKIIGNTMGTLSAMVPILQHAASGCFRPVLDDVLPLGDAKQAQQRLIDRAQFGKIVLKP